MARSFAVTAFSCDATAGSEEMGGVGKWWRKLLCTTANTYNRAKRTVMKSLQPELLFV